MKGHDMLRMIIVVSGLLAKVIHPVLFGVELPC